MIHQNAALVEESTAATLTLSGEASRQSGMVAQFQVSEAGPTVRAA